MEEPVDVAIVGGGIAGLYFAWRLRNRGVSVTLFESSNRLGGRYYTHIAPGGYHCEMGAMRLLSADRMPIIRKVIDDLGLPVKSFYTREEIGDMPEHKGQTHTFISLGKDYFRGKHVNADEKEKLYTCDTEKAVLINKFGIDWVDWPPPDMNFNALRMKGGQLARDTSCHLARALAHDAGVFNNQSPRYPDNCTVAGITGWICFTKGSPISVLDSGMSSLIEALIAQIQNAPSEKILINHKVKMITEGLTGNISLLVSSGGEEKAYNAKKVVLACNAGGVSRISWNSASPRSGILQQMFSRVQGAQAIKVFLTYKEAWWENCGLIAGSVFTDMPLGEIIALGKRAKVGGYATLLAAYTNRYTDIFSGLNLPEYERFQSKISEAPSDLKPSKQLVEFCQQQLKLIFGLAHISDPVYATCYIWNGETNPNANMHYKVNTDHNAMQWSSLKPFPDADIFMTGDTFPVCTKRGMMQGWSESSVMQSERILVKYFGLHPYADNLELENQWPKLETVGEVQ